MEKGQSSKYLNNNFVTYGADVYTGGSYQDYFQHEPERVHRWFVKEETKIQWERDKAAEAKLDPSLKGKVEVYRRPVDENNLLYALANYLGVDGEKTLPRSWDMMRVNALGDLSQDVAYWGLGGAVTGAAIKAVLGDKAAEGLRGIMEEYFKIGSELTETVSGTRKWLAYQFN